MMALPVTTLGSFVLRTQCQSPGSIPCLFPEGRFESKANLRRTMSLMLGEARTAMTENIDVNTSTAGQLSLVECPC